MFTGIVAEAGRVVELRPAADGAELELSHSESLGGALAPGSSLAVNGVCLTVERGSAERSRFALTSETLSRSNLGGLTPGARVNLEPPLRVGDPLGGHWVQGHVDAVVELLERLDGERGSEIWFSLPHRWRPLVAEKGAVALDGVGLTVAERADGRFRVAFVPHTLAVTTFGDRPPGSPVNLEVDLIARYLESLLEERRT